MSPSTRCARPGCGGWMFFSTDPIFGNANSTCINCARGTGDHQDVLTNPREAAVIEDAILRKR